ncbi:hypothetical protein BJX99DRAFT_264853 [Aspergillus californicus]
MSSSDDDDRTVSFVDDAEFDIEFDIADAETETVDADMSDINTPTVGMSYLDSISSEPVNPGSFTLDSSNPEPVTLHSANLDPVNVDLSNPDNYDATGMIEAMHAIDIHAMNASIPENINPALLMVDQNSVHDQPDMSQALWNAIFTSNIETVKYLLFLGAKPLTPTPMGSVAIDMAIRMGNVAIVQLFHRNDVMMGEIGLRSLLTSIVEDRIRIMETVLEMGMYRKLDLNEIMKVIVFGFACKYGTPRMLDTLCQHGPKFSWKAYKLYCLTAAEEGKNKENYQKILELVTEYLLKKACSAKGIAKAQARQAAELMGIPARVAHTGPTAPLFDLMYSYTLANPDAPIQDFLWDEFSVPKARCASMMNPSFEWGGEN